MKKIVYIKQFGCPTMKFFALELSEKLSNSGFRILDANDEGMLGINKEDFDLSRQVDICIFYTCGIVKFCEDKIKRFIDKIRLTNKDVTLIITGCMAEKSNNYGKKIKNINFLSTEPNEIVYYLRSMYPEMEKNKRVIRNNTIVEILVKSNCDKYCSYCIEPFLRRKSKSLSRYYTYKKILYLIKEAEKKGSKQIKLAGVCIGDWKDEKKGLKIEDLLEDILKKTSVSILNLELHPNDINDKIITILSNPRIGRDISVPVESGSDRILRKMNRGYNVQYVRDIFNAIYDVVPDIRITTDVIVGFPGERADDFMKTCELLLEFRFKNVFVMRFNERSGTKAALMSDYVPENTKYRRLKKLVTMFKARNRKLTLRDFTTKNV